MAEQLAEQGWISILIDPEEELESLYGAAVESPEALAGILERRDQKIVVVSATDVDAFVPYGEAILEAADLYRKPIFLMIDEGQLFSGRKRSEEHTSELQSLMRISYAVFCLKKQTNRIMYRDTHMKIPT